MTYEANEYRLPNLEKGEKVLVVLSGGMDSTVCLYACVSKYGRKNVKALTFNYGSKHNNNENDGAKNTCKKLRVRQYRMKLPFINKYFKSDLLKSGGDIPEGHYAAENMKSTVVPFRNGILLSIAAGFAESIGCSCIVLGNHGGDHFIYPDCRPEFIDSMHDAITSGTDTNVGIISPFNDCNKNDIAYYGSQLNVDWNNTWTCYKGGEKHCGVCGSCTERKEAFQTANVKDFTEYLA